VDTQFAVGRHPKSLQLLIDVLKDEKTILPGQFDEAVGRTRRMEGLHQKNTQRTIAVRSFQAETSDLTGRLDIALRANEELMSGLNDERQESSQQQNRLSVERERDLPAQELEFQSRFDDLNAQS
jgi:hypothetical protein